MTECDLIRLRNEMDGLNAQLLDIFLRRMELSCGIMRGKETAGLSEYDSDRENAIVREMAELAGADAAIHVERLFRTVLELCHKRYKEIRTRDC